ncbi:GNAT family N-acetyltransferase [Nonomuraea antri]|uniref:GNAT family N-acetyltransferase n=1 Tax=Nonomuraea antri TaxID=2730852 RepID=UPI001C2BB63F|nr:GNAT family N-acetyltransferase [Nonomuraea antri]
MHVTLRVDATPATPAAPALLLRPWRADDAAALVEAYRDPLLRHWTTLHIENAEDAARWLEIQRHGWETGERLGFAVHEAPSAPDGRPAIDGRPATDSRPGEGGRLVANVVLKRPGRRPDTAEVGYWTAAHARGRGVAPRALDALTTWAFRTFAATGLTQLELLHQVDNQASCRVAEKARYRFHQTLPAHPPFPKDGHLHIRQADSG